MKINISSRHLELTPAIADYVHKKVSHLEHYFDGVVWAQVILTVEKYRQICEIVLHAPRMTFRAKEESPDLYAAIDLATDKAVRQLQRYRDKLKLRRKKKTPKPATVLANINVIAAENVQRPIPPITEKKQFEIKTMHLSQAIEEMENMKYKFFVFMDEANNRLSVVYRRDNGSYGLLELQS